MVNNPKPELETPTKSRGRRLLRAGLRFLLGLFLLFLALLVIISIVVQNENIQNKAAERITTFLSEKLETKVEIEKVSFDFFDQLNFEDFYIEDYNGDTLLNSGVLNANFNTNIFKLIQGHVEITDISLTNADFRIRRDSGRFDTNIQQVMSHLLNPNAQKEKSKGLIDPNSVSIDLDNIYLSNVTFTKLDNLRGELMKVYLDEGDMAIEEFDIANLYIKASTANIHNPMVTVDQYERNEDLFNEWYYMEDSTGVVELHPDSIPKTFIMDITEVRLHDGMFRLDNIRREPVRAYPEDELSYHHLNGKDIQIAIDSFRYEDWKFSGQLGNLSFKEDSGFELKNFSGNGFISETRTEINNVSISTPTSTLGDTLIFRYSEYLDFFEFPEKIRMDLKFNDSKFSIKDLITFVPPLRKNEFLLQNINEILQIDGRITGKVNNLRGRDLDLSLGQNFSMKGKFSSRDLAVKNEEFLNLRLERLKTDLTTLRLLIPKFNLPTNFDKLNNLDFSGKFDGFLNNFVADGLLVTDLGKAEMDMQMVLTGGREKATYSGNLALIDFDLAQFSGDNRFGKVSFSSKVKNGVGLSLDNVNTTLSANIESFPFQGYTYENLTMEGQLRKNVFNGDFTISDENIDFAFDGQVNFEEEIPVYDFKAKVKRIDLQRLNLSKQDFVISGDVDLNLNGKTLSDMDGLATVRDLGIIYNDSSTYNVDTISVSSQIDGFGQKVFNVESDIVDLTLQGQFDIQDVPNVMVDFFIRKYPNYAKKFNVKKPAKEIKESEFGFTINLKDSKNFTQLLDAQVDTIRNAKVNGYLSNITDSLNLKMDVPTLKVQNIEFTDITLEGDANREDSEFDLEIYHTTINDKTHIEPILLFAIIEKDTIDFSLSSLDFSSVLDNLNLGGQLTLTADDLFQVTFNSSDLVLLNDKWDIQKDNYIRFGNNVIETQNFILQNEENILKLDTYGEKGLSAEATNLPFDLINEYWVYKPLDFDGFATIRAKADNIFTLENLSAEIESDTLLINNDDWGALSINATTKSINDKINTYLSLTKEDQQLIAEGFYLPPNANVVLKGKRKAKDYFNIDLDVSNFPVDMLQYFIPTGISEVEGSFGGKLNLNGLPKRPNISGGLTFYDGAVKIDYLNTKYFFNNQYVEATNSMFDAGGGTITDRDGRIARVYGGISHEHLKNLGLAARIETDEFLALDTPKDESALYYGTAIGSGIIKFTGSFRQSNIDATATALDGTNITIPVTYEKDGSEISFIKFIDKSKKEEEEENRELRGVNFGLNLTMTDEAKTRLVFDERSGDILEGWGNGDLQIRVERTGLFTMYGNYEVERGDYLFTYKTLNVSLINKPFSVKRGGTIRWYGDPFEAQINLEADYKGLNTAPYNLVSEYLDGLDSDQLKSDARQTTNVDLTMLLRGELLQPNITFDIDMPNVRGELGNYVDNKIRLLRQDENELNRQVFGLIVIGGFLPSNSSALQGQGLITGINTVSQVLSNQLSIYVTQLVSELLKEAGPISGFDFDVNYNEFLVEDISTFSRGREFSFAPKVYLWDDRFSIEGNIGYGNQTVLSGASANGLTSRDFVIEYAITEDKRLKIRYYNRLESRVDGKRNRNGLGIGYRRDFDTLREFFKFGSDAKKEKKKKEKGNN